MKTLVSGIVMATMLSASGTVFAFEWQSWVDKAKNMASDIAGDWCSGKEYGFSEMKMSDRIEYGSKDLYEQIGKLNEISSKMLYDIKFHIDENVERAKQDNNDLSRRTVSLCKTVKAEGFNSVDYGGITLRDKDEILAQVRLNIATARSNREIITYLQDKKAEYNGLNERIIRKANELAVLRKGFDDLMDPRSRNRSPAYFESTIKNACVSIDESENLMMQYDEKSLFELFRDASQKHKAKSISEGELEGFMNTCAESAI